MRTLRALYLEVLSACVNDDQSESAGVGANPLALRHVLESAAYRIFQTLVPDCPDFAVVAFDTWADCDIEESCHRTAFVRVKQITASGQTTYTGTAVDFHMVKHYEPYSDLLDEEQFVFA